MIIKHTPFKNAVAGATAMAAAAIMSPAYAGGVDQVRWCEGSTAAPAQTSAMLVIMPDGKPRGLRSAATLIAEARKAVHGDPDRAIQWAVSCQWHNPGAAGEIVRDRAQVISYLGA